MRSKRILYLLILLLGPLSAAAQTPDPVREILVICSHSESSGWAHDMLRPVVDLCNERADLRAHLNYLRMTSIDSVQDLEARTSEIIDSCSFQPSLVVIVGGSGYQLAYHVDRRWPGIPQILSGEIPYYCDDSYTIYGKADPDAARYPVQDMRDKGLNVTLIHAPAMVEQTVGLMFTLQPEIRRFLFIAGENFQSKDQQLRLERFLAERHPDVEYRPVFSSELTTDELIALLGEEQFPGTGVLFASWLTHQDYLETINSRNNITHVLESIAPIYTIFQCDLSRDENVVGYFSYDHGQYYKLFRQRLAEVLDERLRPAIIPITNLEVGCPSVNWHAMELFGLDTERIPEDAILFEAPQTLWEAHKPTIMWAAFFLLVGLGLFVYYVMRQSVNSLKKANEIAEKGNQMRTAFVQNISHEIRTPLNAVIGFSQLLCLPDDYTSEDEKLEYMEYVTNNASLLTVIINDLLSLSDMENGRFGVNISPCNLNAVVRLAIKSIEYRIPFGVELVRRPGIPEDLRLEADGMRVQQVLINLLTNACKYTEEGTITIASSLEENPGYVTFSVADTGPGVPKEKAEEIFERFAKLDNNKQGTGIGLTICKLIASNLNGEIWLDTDYTGGARFVFMIPYKESADQR
jgi:signal transduction histidine kinase